MAIVQPSTRKARKAAREVENLPKHTQRSKARKAERKVRAWSADRPTRADFSSDLLRDLGQVVTKGSAWEQANETGLSITTIYNLRNKKTHTAMMTTLQMLARAAGGRLMFVKDH